MKRFAAAMFMTIAMLAANALATPAAGSAESGEGDQVGSCVWECPPTGTFYQKSSLCMAACSSTCEPICW